MPRGSQLSQLVEMLRAEVGDSLRTDTGIDQGEAYKRRLARWQVMLNDAHDWPFMNIRPFKQLSASGRFYDLPDGLVIESVESVTCLSAGSIYDISRGILASDYASFDPYTPELSDPVRKWDVQFTGTKDQIEVWPVPQTSTVLQFFGKKALSPLVSNSDTADLDDILIVLHTAADHLRRKKDPSWESLSNQAARRLDQLMRKSSVGRPPISTSRPQGIPAGYAPPSDGAGSRLDPLSRQTSHTD